MAARSECWELDTLAQLLPTRGTFTYLSTISGVISITLQYPVWSNHWDHISYPGIVNIDRNSKRVVVRAGTLLKDFNKELRIKGLALPNLPTLGDQTIGGALAVGKKIIIKPIPDVLLKLWFLATLKASFC